MTDLTESQIYESGIYQLETTDPVVAGPDGISNLQARQLANRTAWLKQRVDQLLVDMGSLGIADVAALQAALDGKLDAKDELYTQDELDTNFVSKIATEVQEIQSSVRFPHTNQIYSSDGTIGSGVYKSGLNIVGVQTEPDEGRVVRLWGDLLTSQDHLFWHTGNNSQTGMVAFFARSSAPDGWLKANGAKVSRTTYADLFAAIGTTFGDGNGSSTFEVPDLRGEFARGWSDGRGVDSERAFGSLQSEGLKSHKHMTAVPAHTTNRWGLSSEVSSGWKADTSTSLKAPYTSGTDGTETRPRNVALLACIKY